MTDQRDLDPNTSKTLQGLPADPASAGSDRRSCRKVLTGSGSSLTTMAESPQGEDQPEDEEALDDDSDAFDDGNTNRGRPSVLPGHDVMDCLAITEALRVPGFDGSFDALSSGEEQRVRMLLHLRTKSLFRPHVIGSHTMIDGLRALDRQSPNFAAVTALVRRAAHLSLMSGAPLRVPPLVLQGQPGIGKSRYVRALAACLGTSCEIINGSTLPDTSSLTGYPPVWRGAGPGRIAKAIISARTSGPVLLIDESDKICDFESKAKPLDRLLPLLEYSTAAIYQDDYLLVPMRAQCAIVIFACNALDGMSDPFRSRVLTIRIPDLSPAQRDAVLEAILAEVAQDLGVTISLASGNALAPIRALGMRRCRLAFEIAIGHAVEAGRRFLIASDLAAAVTMLGRPDERRPIGFLHHRTCAFD